MKNCVTRMLKLDYTIILWLHTEEPTSDAEWAAGMELVRAHDVASHGDMERLRFFVITDGGSPTTKMRQDWKVVLDGRKHKAAILMNMNSAIMRGIVTAASWFNPDVKAFAPSELAKALNHVGLKLEDADRILAEMHDMQRELKTVKALIEVAAVRREKPRAIS
jgi:hypothetical protein